MTSPRFDAAISDDVERVLGYLNFSSGSHDPNFLKNLNEIFHHISNSNQDPSQTHELVHQLLVSQLQSAQQNSAAFTDATQAERAIELVFRYVLPGYLAHHRDLLFHRGPETIFNAFFVARAFEIVLQNVIEQEDSHRASQIAIGKLNDFIGHRPVATLESQKLQPYEFEWVRPIPLYVRGAGVVHGRYTKIVQCAIQLLMDTGDEILIMAQFDPELLDELAIDPRSFDFEHPVNKRPNHHFGQWDEHQIDGNGNYRRFIIHQVTLDALTSRVENGSEKERDELILEAGAVLAGTILMAAGICGRGPGAHDSTVTLTDLLPVVAHYRDAFYNDLLEKVPEPHRTRLVDESIKRQQPFGSARQHLNRQLARHRAFQMVHVNLALIYSRMGYDQAAMRHANVLPVASARMLCQIDCLLYAGRQAIEEVDLQLAADSIPRIFDLLKRAVECGAIIDPWNIIGFDANYNLFQGTENTVRDHRADELVLLMEQLFSFGSQVWIAAEAADDASISKRVRGCFGEIVDWWRKFAVHELSTVDATDPQEIFDATENVAKALNLWHKSGADRGNVEFWASHAKLFDSPRAYILAIECLIDRDDYLTSMALLIHWLSQSDLYLLQQGSSSFQMLLSNWIGRQRALLDAHSSPEMATETWQRVRKFCDYMEANAGEFWNVPKFELSGRGAGIKDQRELLSDEIVEDDENLYRAAYEDMVYRETTDDGFDGSVFDSSVQSDEDLHYEVERLNDRLEFLESLAHYWFESALLINRIVSDSGCETASDQLPVVEELVKDANTKIDDWAQQATRNFNNLERLVDAIQSYELPEPDGSIDSLVRYDRHRLFKETLLDNAINVSVETANAARLLSALSMMMNQQQDDANKASSHPNAPSPRLPDTTSSDLECSGWSDSGEDLCWCRVLSAVLRGRTDEVVDQFVELVVELTEQPLLYVPLSKGGDPKKIVSARVRQSSVSQLLECLPRLGMFLEARELIHTALMMERNQRVRQGAVTEFDELFRIGYSSMVRSLIKASQNLQEPADDPSDGQDAMSKEAAESSLFDCLEMLTESMLLIWLSHSQTLRLSVLEKVKDDSSWQKLVDFINQFGEQIFTQQFLNLSNIRAILHQGVDRWLTQLEETPQDFELAVVRELDNGYPRKDAIRFLTLVLEAIIENFNEYRDYNCTTTQSDNGQLLFNLLDFLRLRCRYDQVCWNLKPVIWAHEELVRNRQNNVARLWRRLLTERVNPEADKFVDSLKQLQEKYSIQMATVSQRINERFVHPMHVDRLISLVQLAMQDPRDPESNRAFEMIEHHAKTLTQQPIGVGFELPPWIVALDEEVERVIARRFGSNFEKNDVLIDTKLPPIDQLRDQLEEMPRRQ